MKESQEKLPAKKHNITLYLILFSILLVTALIVVLTRPKKIAYESFLDGNFEIYVMDEDGKNQKRLTFNDYVDDKDAKISHDGKLRLYS